MNPKKLAGIALIAVGVLGLLYGGFNYRKDKEIAKIGTVEFSMETEETVTVPVWLSIGAVIAGAALLAFGGRKG